MLSQKVIQNVSDPIETYLVVRSRGNGGYGKVHVERRVMTHMSSRHLSAPKNHHPVETLRDEWNGINEPHL